MTVKLSSLAADLKVEADGEWIDFPDWPGVAFNVRSLHEPAYVTERDLALQKLARRYRGKSVPTAELADASGKIYCKRILRGWRGLDEEYSPELALTTLCDPAYRKVVEAVEWCAGRVGQRDIEFLETAEKN